MAPLLLVFTLHCLPQQLSHNLETEWGKKKLFLVFIKVHNDRSPYSACLISFILQVDVNAAD